MDHPVPLIICVLLAGVAVLAHPHYARMRASAMLASLALAVAILLSSIWNSSQLHTVRSHSGPAIAAAVVGLVGIGVLAWLIDRHPPLLAYGAMLTLPFRIPISAGGTTSNLLVPLYVVVGAGALAYAVPRLRGRVDDEEVAPGRLEWALMSVIGLYAIQASYSDDFQHALVNVVFFYVPFAILFVVLRRVRWTQRLALECLGILAGLAVIFVAIGFWEYHTRHLFLNPKVIADNQFATYFRVNSLFFDPNIYGRFLAVVMLGVTGVVLWTRERRVILWSALLLALLWGGMLLTLSQSSFGALLVGLAVLLALRWSVRGAAALTVTVVAVGAVLALAAPSAVRLHLGGGKAANATTNGRYDLVKGAVNVFKARPIQGYGSGSFSHQYRKRVKASSENATSASHTIPLTVAAEQGVIGLIPYIALLVFGFATLLRGARGSPVRAVLVASFAAVFFHTLVYASYLEDPVTWVLLALGGVVP